MKQSYVIVLSGIVTLLLGIELLLIYIACTTQTNKDIKFNYQEMNTTISANTTTVTTVLSSQMDYSTENTGVPIKSSAMTSTTTSFTKSTLSTSEKTTTTNRTTMPSHPNTTTIQFTTQATRCGTKCITHLPSSITTYSTTPIPLPPIVSLTTKVTPKSPTSTNHDTTEVTTKSTTEVTTKSTTEVTTKSTTEVTTKKNIPCLAKITNPKFNYIVRNAEKGIACVLANMTIRINLQHVIEDFKVLTLTVPVNATPTGFCDEKTANMTLSWKETARNQMSDDKKNKITFNYAHDNIDFFLDSIFVDVYWNEERIRENTLDRLRLFSAAVKHGIFICEIDTKINIRNRIDLVISDIYLTVFNECFDNGIKIETNCIIKKGIKISATIGIVIVGILLAFFILYLIWYIYHIRYIRRLFKTLFGTLSGTVKK